jgi:hypothetical protein
MVWKYLALLGIWWQFIRGQGTPMALTNRAYRFGEKCFGFPVWTRFELSSVTPDLTLPL